MKRKIAILLLVLLLAFGSISASAATVIDRLAALESAIGIPATNNNLIDRLHHLERQLGVTPAAGSTIEDRLAALESLMGTGSSYIAFDNAEYVDRILLDEIGYFMKDDCVRVPNATNLYSTDNYGNDYSTLVYSVELDGSIEYQLNGAYTIFLGTLFVPDQAVKTGHDHHWTTASVSFYGDDELLFTTTEKFEAKSEPLPVILDVSGISYLKVVFHDANYYNTGRTHPLVALGDPAVVE